MPKRPGAYSQNLISLLGQIIQAGADRDMTAAEIAVQAGIDPTQLSKMKSRGSADFGTVEKLAAVVGLQITLTHAESTADAVARGEFF